MHASASSVSAVEALPVRAGPLRRRTVNQPADCPRFSWDWQRLVSLTPAHAVLAPTPQVVDQGGGRFWSEADSKVVEKPEHRYLLSVRLADHTGETNVQLFGKEVSRMGLREEGMRYAWERKGCNLRWMRSAHAMAKMRGTRKLGPQVQDCRRGILTFII